MTIVVTEFDTRLLWYKTVYTACAESAVKPVPPLARVHLSIYRGPAARRGVSAEYDINSPLMLGEIRTPRI